MSTYYSTRRMSGNSKSENRWTKGHNAVRQDRRITLGTTSYTVLMFTIVALFGMIYISQGAKITEYDYNIMKASANVNMIEDELASKRIENDRAVASMSDESQNEVASTMVDAKSAGFVEQ